MSQAVDAVFDLLFGGLANILVLVVVLIVMFALTERWRIERNARRKRERQNRARPEDV